ncbi:MAG: alpha/beta hydrolase [Planctomycetes bacterium]|nr:alpha/beta hydrolase [Planctomycetota bacterium]
MDLVFLCLFTASFLNAGDGRKESRGMFTVAGDAIRLEYAWSEVEGPGQHPAVVLCHPDPRMGGTMDDRVVCALAARLNAAGHSVLRFNFRGVGGSEGRFGDGDGEKRDCQAAMAFLSSRPAVDASRLFLVGYSFGSVVGLEAALDERGCRGYAGVGYPTDCFKGEGAAERPNGGLPLLFIGGDQDPWCRVAELEKAVSGARLQAEFHVIPKANHFFRREDELEQVAEAVLKFLESAGRK